MVGPAVSTPQGVQYGEVVPIASWKYAAPVFSANVNAEIREVCEVPVAEAEYPMPERIGLDKKKFLQDETRKRFFEEH